MQQAGPSPKRRRFHCREQDWGGGWTAQSAKDEGCGQIRPADSGVRQDAGGRGLFSGSEPHTRDPGSVNTFGCSRLVKSKSSDKASFKNTHVVKDDSAAFLHLVKREYISEPPMSPLTTQSDTKQNDYLLVR